MNDSPQKSSPGTDSNASHPRGPILVIDDEADIRVAVEMILQYEGYEVWTAKSGREGLERLAAEAEQGQPAAAVLCDVKMPGMDGLEVLDALLERPSSPPVLMISGHADVTTAVDAVKRGAADFLEKPLEQNRLLVSLRGALSRGRLERANAALRSQLGRSYQPVGKSAAWLALMKSVERAAASDASVLITGENGTGKEVIARNLHLLGPRAEQPFIAVNCAAIPDELIESELFGHEKGAFTGAHDQRIGHFEAADGGTLFLDEIGDMPLSAQSKVLRALESFEVTRVGGSGSRKVDIRVIAATNADLAAAVEETAFRMDLFYRLNVIPLRVPPLRERNEDVALLAQHFADALAQRTGAGSVSIEPEALARLTELDFPGNVRQLRNLIEGAFVFSDDNRIRLDDLEQLLANGPALSSPESPAGGGGLPQAAAFEAPTFEEFKNQSEALFFRLKLASNDGNVKRTAEQLGMQRSHLYKKLDRYELR